MEQIDKVMLKKLCQSGEIYVRPPYVEGRDVPSTVHICIGASFAPSRHNQDVAFMRRVKVIPFVSKFEDITNKK